MTLILLALGGTAVLIGAVYVMTAGSAVHAALAGEHTAVGLGDPSAETLGAAYQTQTPPPVGTDWHLTTVNDLTDAEDLLDCLEGRGVAERELVVLGNSCFAVRWR